VYMCIQLMEGFLGIDSITETSFHISSFLILSTSDTSYGADSKAERRKPASIGDDRAVSSCCLIPEWREERRWTVLPVRLYNMVPFLGKDLARAIVIRHFLSL
jgi:hypothetical protein